MGDMERFLYTGSPHKVLLDFNPPFSLITPQSLGEQQWDEKEIEKETADFRIVIISLSILQISLPNMETNMLQLES